MNSRTITRVIAVAGVALLGLAAMAPASAKPEAPKAEPSGHCVIGLARGQTTAASTHCFATFAEATSFATHGRVSGAQVGELGTQAFAEKVGQSNRQAADSVTPQAIVLSWAHEGAPPSSGAWTITFTGDFNCTVSFADTDYSIVLDPAYWDQISSFSSPSYVCYVNHYYWETFGTPNTGYWVCPPSWPPNYCLIPTMNPGGFPGDNNTRALTWT